MNKSKLALLLITISLLSACAEKEQYKQAVLEQMKNEQDIKDYKIDPEVMANCVVDTTSRNMAGFFPVDPERKKAYVAYTKMININKSKDPKAVMAELRNDFGSPQELSYAHSNYTESILGCQTGLISQTEEEQKAETAAKNKGAETNEDSATTENSAPPTSTNFNAVQAPVNIPPQAESK